MSPHLDDKNLNNNNKENKPNQRKQRKTGTGTETTSTAGTKCAEIPSKRRFTDKTFAYFDWTRPVRYRASGRANNKAVGGVADVPARS